MDIIDLLANDNYIIVNKDLIKALGLKESVLIGELASEYRYYKTTDRLQEGGWFFSTVENIENNLSHDTDIDELLRNVI